MMIEPAVPQAPGEIYDAVMLATGDSQLARTAETKAAIALVQQQIKAEQMMKNAGR